MLDRVNEHLHRLGNRFHAFCLGTTAALLTTVFNQAGQSCALSGQCASCGACVSRVLPVVALPLVLDGVVILTRKVLNSVTGSTPEAENEARGPDDLRSG